MVLDTMDVHNSQMVIIFGVDNSSSVHVDNKKKDHLVHCEDPTQRLYDTTIATEAKYYINFAESRKRFVLSLHYDGINSFLIVNATKIYQFKVKYSKIKPCPLCLCNILKDFTINNMNKTELK